MNTTVVPVAARPRLFGVLTTPNAGIHTHPKSSASAIQTGQCWQGALASRVRLWARGAADPPPTMCVSFAPAMDNPPSRTHQTPTSSDHCVISTASKLCCSRRTNNQWPAGDLGPALPPTTGLPRHWSVQTWAGRVHASTHCSQADTAYHREHAPHHTCCSQARHTHVQASSEARAELCQCRDSSFLRSCTQGLG